MSLAHSVEFMRQCHAEKTAYQIILVHGSERHLYPEEATRKFEQVLGVPTYYARKGLEINLM